MEIHKIQQGQIELVNNEKSEASLLNSISQELTKHRAHDIHCESHQLQFKSGFLRTELNPLAGISSGLVTVSINNNKFIVSYILELKHLFTWAVLAVAIILSIGIFNSHNLTISYAASLVIGSSLVYLFIYYGYYGIISTRFNNLLNRANINLKSANKR